MRSSDKSGQVGYGPKFLGGTDFHNIFQRQEQSATNFVISEFGLSIGEIERMKKYFQKR